jgi:tetratricopeptide (TPR) repeat protein
VRCGAENDDEARFCDQCAEPLNPAAAEGAASRPQREPTGRAGQANWPAIAVIVALVGVIGWLLFVPHGAQKPAMPGGGGAADPHAGMDMTNPPGEAGQGAGGAMDAQISQQIAAAKTALDRDSLDTQALVVLYRMYGMIGRQQELRPLLDKAYGALVKRRGELGDQAAQRLRELAVAAMRGNDIDGALAVLTKYRELEPQNLSLLGMLGDVCYDAGKPEEAIKWYSEYLDKAKPEVEGEAYWRVRTDRATMYMEAQEPQGQGSNVAQAIAELQYITQQVPALWNAWFNLGMAYEQSGAKQKAETALNKALGLAKGEMDRWQVQSELAKLKGQPPPPRPQSPHGDMGMGTGMGGGTVNPHQGMGGGGNPHQGMGGMTNPHSGMGSGA